LFASLTGQPLNVVRAVAMQESGLDPYVVNSIGCVGLWQLNSACHPIGTPYEQTIYAAQMFNEQGWTPWEAYTSGAYTKYL